MKNNATPISDIDHKIDIIDHVNQDHPEELLAIARSHVKNKEIVSAKVEDIYREGVLIDVTFKVDGAKQEVFVPFEIEGSLEEKILYLAYASIVKQGLDFSGSGKQFFEVTDKYNITPNIIRLKVKSDMPIPEYYPGYAYALVLKGLKKQEVKKPETSKKKPWLKNVFDHLFIFLMKHLSKKNREKLLYKTNKDVRLYTLRQSWKSSESVTSPDCGSIDIYTHGETAGSEWAKQLSVGDVFMSRSETADKHPHLASGQAVIIADETAYPAAAGILEHWDNPLAPSVITISSSHDEQSYFTESMLPAGSTLHRVVCSASMQGEEVLRILKSIEAIDCVWAALESSSAKSIRHFLRNERQISGKNNHTKAYWNLKMRN